MPPENELPSDSDGNLDYSAIASQLAGDLLDRGGAEGKSDPEPIEPQVPGPAGQLGNPPPPSPAPPPEIDPASQIPADMPKAWPKENAVIWTGLSPEAKAYMTKREADISRGIQMYQADASQWQKTLAPYAEVMKQHQNVDPVMLLQNLMNSHLQLLSLPPDQKKQFAMTLLQAYGISDLTGVAAPPPGPDPALMNRLQSLEGQLNGYLVAEQKKIVDAFFDDPKNVYAKEVASDIQQLLATGQAKDLKDAYEKALWLNPDVRQKQLDAAYTERKRKEQEDAQKKEKLKKLNVNGSDDPGTPAPKKGTVDDTINGVLAKYVNTP